MPAALSTVSARAVENSCQNSRTGSPFGGNFSSSEKIQDSIYSLSDTGYGAQRADVLHAWTGFETDT